MKERVPNEDDLKRAVESFQLEHGVLPNEIHMSKKTLRQMVSEYQANLQKQQGRPIRASQLISILNMYVVRREDLDYPFVKLAYTQRVELPLNPQKPEGVYELRELDPAGGQA